MEIMILLIILVGFVALSGPIALIISLVQSGKISYLENQIKRLALGQKAPAARNEQAAAEIAPVIEAKSAGPTLPSAAPLPARQVRSGGIEQAIGTRWVLAAGVVSVIVAVGFFLKYAYENAWIGPWARVGVVAAGGFAALIVGEITRRRGYEIVAKGVSALGFAILYASVFSAYRVYELVGPGAAFASAVAVTVFAMAYAVWLNEVFIAFVSLLGGFLTPVLVSTGENRPGALFGYVLILSLGAMACGAFRRWRAVNWLAFIGTFVLYTMWFEKFCRPVLAYVQAQPGSILPAMVWLGVFFMIYLTGPLLYGLLRKERSAAEDATLAAAVGPVAFFYLWTMLYEFYRPELALWTACIGSAYLAAAFAVYMRCRQDRELCAALTTAGLAFITGAIPLYFNAYAAAVGWGIEGVVLTAAGVFFASVCVQGMGLIGLALSLCGLVYQLPMHEGTFHPVLNGQFGSWMFTAVCVWVSHWFYRLRSEDRENQSVGQLLYIGAAIIAAVAAGIEWHSYCRQAFGGTAWVNAAVIKGMLYICAATILLLPMRLVGPGGIICRTAALLTGLLGGLFAVGAADEIYRGSFIFAFNKDFAAQAAVAAAIFAAGWICRDAERKEGRFNFAAALVIAGIVCLWAMLSEQVYYYWYCLNRYAGPAADWRFSMNLTMSLTWAGYGAALLIAGFRLRTARLRYLALGLFALLLGKIFVVDMAAVESIYRITAFLATGLTLVGVSYLYQFLKKKGFFDMTAKSSERE